MLFGFALMFLFAATVSNDIWRENRNLVAGAATGVFLFAFAALTVAGLVFLTLDVIGDKS